MGVYCGGEWLGGVKRTCCVGVGVSGVAGNGDDKW